MTDELRYDLIQSPKAKNFLIEWSSNFGIGAVFISILLPVIGVILAVYSIIFSLKLRGKLYLFPWLALLISVGLLFVHVYVWSNILYSI